MGVVKRKRPATAASGKPEPPAPAGEDVAMTEDAVNPAEERATTPKLSKSAARKRRQAEQTNAKKGPSVGDSTSFLDLFVYMTSPSEEQRQAACISLVQRVAEAESKVGCWVLVAGV